jgi:hypothetical protein
MSSKPISIKASVGKSGGVPGGSAAQKPSLIHTRRLLRPLGTSLLTQHARCLFLANRRVRTRTHGGVAGKASDRLHMSIVGR